MPLCIQRNMGGLGVLCWKDFGPVLIEDYAFQTVLELVHNAA